MASVGSPAKHHFAAMVSCEFESWSLHDRVLPNSSKDGLLIVVMWIAMALDPTAAIPLRQAALGESGNASYADHHDFDAAVASSNVFFDLASGGAPAGASAVLGPGLSLSAGGVLCATEKSLNDIYYSFRLSKIFASFMYMEPP